MCSHGTLLQFCSVTKNLLHKRVSLVETIQRLHCAIHFEPARCHAKLKMLCLIRCQQGLSLYDEALHLWRETLFETTLHLTHSVADARRELHESSFRCSRRLIQCHLNLYFWLSLHSEQICSSLNRSAKLRPAVPMVRDLYSLTPCFCRGVLVSRLQILSSRNQGLNRAPGS